MKKNKKEILNGDKADVTSSAIRIRVEMIIELDGGVWNFKDKEERAWFDNNVMQAEQLYFHSNEIGDSVGEVKKLIKWEIVK